MWLSTPQNKSSLVQHRRSIWLHTCRTKHAAPPPPQALLFLEQLFQPKTSHARLQTVQDRQQLVSLITEPDVNIVWWPRTKWNTTKAVEDATRAVGLFKEQVVVIRDGDVSVEQQIQRLFPNGTANPLHALLAEDVCNVVHMYLDALGRVVVGD